MITPALVKKYMASEFAREAVKYLGDPPQPPISQQAHTRVRNLLIVMIGTGNATRAGGISGITLEKFQKAVYYPEYDNWIIQVLIVLQNACY